MSGLGEVWVEIAVFPSHEVSTYGAVRSVQRKFSPRHRTNAFGEAIVTLTKKQPFAKGDNKGKYFSMTETVAKLVASAFVQNPENGEAIKHKNGDKMDNRAENLEWVTVDATERWGRIPYFPNYEVSSDGNMRNFNSKKPLKISRGKDGYEYVTMYEVMTSQNRREEWRDIDAGKKRYFTRSIHTLSARTFIANPDNKPTVNHLNKIRHDNRLENLEWATYGEQATHSSTMETPDEYRYRGTHTDDGTSEVYVSIESVGKQFWISNKGNVRGHTIYYDSRGYASIRTATKCINVHRLVAAAFLPETFTKECIINHLDGIKSNNQVSNLECVTQSKNIKHAYANDLIKKLNKVAVIRVNDEGSIVGRYASMTEAETKTNINRGLIFNAIKNKAITGKSRWFEDVESLAAEVSSQTFKKNFTQVYQVELSSKVLVNSFKNYPAAEEATHICSKAIYNAIHRKTQPAIAGGFVWFNNRQALEDFLGTSTDQAPETVQITNAVATMVLEY